MAALRPDRWASVSMRRNRDRWAALLVGLGAAALACRHAAIERPVAVAAHPASGPRTFACGGHTCDARESYCEMIKTDYAPLPSTYACKPLPAACATADPAVSSCECFPEGTRCDFCSKLERDGVSHFQRTCVGGR